MSSLQQFGKYTLIERIAVGGMAEIYRAKTFGAAGFEKDLVVKRILPQFSSDDDFVRMFIDEARIAAKLQHANIVQIYDFDCAQMTDGDSYYIAMELVDGKDLRHLLKESIRRNLPMALSHCVHIAVETLKGLHHAHTKAENGKPLNIVHRDVSPHNVLVSYSGDVKISDFGIAKAAARASATSNGMVKGKLAYMSPEQVTGQALDRRTDVFSAGICLYEMLTRTRLFVAETEGETIARVRDAVVPPMRQRNPQIPVDVEQVVMHMLSHDLDSRFSNAAEAAKALSGTSVFSANEALPLGEYVKKLFPETARRTVAPPAGVGKPGQGQPQRKPAPSQVQAAGSAASTSGIIEPARNPMVAKPAPLPAAPVSAPVSELATAILDASSPQGANIAAQIAAVAAAQRSAEAAGAAAGGHAGPAVAEMSTKILDSSSPEGVKIAAQIAAAIKPRSPGASVVVDGAVSGVSVSQKPIVDQSTAILDTSSPGLAHVQAQIAAASAAAAAVAAAHGASSGPLATMVAAPAPVIPHVNIAPTPSAAGGGGQRTMMYDGPIVNLGPKPPPPLNGARSLPPMPSFPEVATWHRWAIGPGIMAATAIVTIVVATFVLPAGTVKKIGFKGDDAVATKTSKILLSTNPSRASVTLDGRSWPKFTPTQIEAPVGKSVHIIASLDGYKPAEADVVFSEDPHPLTLTLDREDPDHPVASHTATGANADDGKSLGKIDIFVHPWALVFVDGERQRRTPIANLELKPGKHVIDLVNDEKGKRESVNVVIKAGINPEIRREWQQ